MNDIRVGVVGIGNIGSMHATNLYSKKIKGASLAAVCDIDPQKKVWAKEHLKGVEFFDSFEQMITSGKIDAVIASVPHPLHPVVAECGFKNGLHVLSEKPIGVTTKSAEKLNEIAEKSGKVFVVMHNQRVNPVFNKAREIFKGGEIGELVRFVWIITNWYRLQQYYESSAWRATWKGEGGGVLANQCPHNIDIMQWIVGVPKKVKGNCKYGKYHDIEVEDDVTAYFEFENGASGVFISSTGENPGTNHLEISGTKGKMILEDGKIRLWKTDIPEPEYRYFSNEEYAEKVKFKYEELVLPQLPYGEEHIAIVQNFINAISKGEKLISPGIEGINGLTISNAIHLSDWTGETVEIPFDSEEHERLLNERIKKSTKRNTTQQDDSIHMGEMSSRWEVKW
ncbi:MAG: Gfo/Idh/MocA family oxidoreductase [Clostridia bacterium]|nr:Gfo/Idh/MocA family oxidoreductase [Clostridia bacterium]